MTIQSRQNSREGIDRLVSQRFLYSRTKVWRNLRMYTIAFVCAICCVILALDLSSVAPIVSTIVLISWFLDSTYLRKQENASKRRAVAMQEDFDCLVLDLPWPVHKQLGQPKQDEIRQLAFKAQRAGVSRSVVRNWYTEEGISGESPEAVVACQRQNVWWDRNLHERWKQFLKVAAIGMCLVMLCVASWGGITVNEIVIVAAANIRLLNWVFEEFGEQSTATTRAGFLHARLTDISGQSQLTQGELRQLQDGILEHRLNSVTVPDWFYWRHKPNLEREAGH